MQILKMYRKSFCLCKPLKCQNILNPRPKFYPIKNKNPPLHRGNSFSIFHIQINCDKKNVSKKIVEASDIRIYAKGSIEKVFIHMLNHTIG